MQKCQDIPTPPLWLALIPLVVTGGTLAYSVFVLETDPHFSLFLGGVTAGLCAYGHGVPWLKIKEGLKLAIGRTIPSLIILLIIGMLIAVWIASGIVPALMLVGLEFVVARWFLPAMLLFSGVMALLTGSSWSTVGTIGVAAIGVGEGLGIPPAMTAGAVVSGAFFGDKISPMSDSTNLTPSVLGVHLFEHIKHMLFTTLPSLTISLIAFTVIGFFVAGNGGDADIALYVEPIREHFNLSPWLILPPVIVIGLIVAKVPAIPSLIAGVILGGAAYLLLQGGNLAGLSDLMHTGVAMDTGNARMDELFSRGGLESMYSVVILAMISLALGGIMNYTGMLHSIVLKLSRLLTTVGNLTATVVGTSVFINAFTSNQYLAVILPGQMYEECYRKHGLKLKNLTRTLEAGGTLTAPLIPWNASGVFIFATLGVPVLAYAPFALVCWLTPVIAIAFGYLNISMHRVAPTEVEPEDQQ